MNKIIIIIIMIISIINKKLVFIQHFLHNTRRYYCWIIHFITRTVTHIMRNQRYRFGLHNHQISHLIFTNCNNDHNDDHWKTDIIVVPNQRRRRRRRGTISNENKNDGRRRKSLIIVWNLLDRIIILSHQRRHPVLLVSIILLCCFCSNMTTATTTNISSTMPVIVIANATKTAHISTKTTNTLFFFEQHHQQQEQQQQHLIDNCITIRNERIIHHQQHQIVESTPSSHDLSLLLTQQQHQQGQSKSSQQHQQQQQQHRQLAALDWLFGWMFNTGNDESDPPDSSGGSTSTSTTSDNGNSGSDGGSNSNYIPTQTHDDFDVDDNDGNGNDDTDDYFQDGTNSPTQLTTISPTPSTTMSYSTDNTLYPTPMPPVTASPTTLSPVSTTLSPTSLAPIILSPPSLSPTTILEKDYVISENITFNSIKVLYRFNTSSSLPKVTFNLNQLEIITRQYLYETIYNYSFIIDTTYNNSDDEASSSMIAVVIYNITNLRMIQITKDFRHHRNRRLKNKWKKRRKVQEEHNQQRHHNTRQLESDDIVEKVFSMSGTILYYSNTKIKEIQRRRRMKEEETLPTPSSSLVSISNTMNELIVDSFSILTSMKRYVKLLKESDDGALQRVTSIKYSGSTTIEYDKIVTNANNTVGNNVTSNDIRNEEKQQVNNASNPNGNGTTDDNDDENINFNEIWGDFSNPIMIAISVGIGIVAAGIVVFTGMICLYCYKVKRRKKRDAAVIAVRNQMRQSSIVMNFENSNNNNGPTVANSNDLLLIEDGRKNSNNNKTQQVKSKSRLSYKNDGIAPAESPSKLSLPKLAFQNQQQRNSTSKRNSIIKKNDTKNNANRVSSDNNLRKYQQSIPVDVDEVSLSTSNTKIYGNDGDESLYSYIHGNNYDNNTLVSYLDDEASTFHSSYKDYGLSPDSNRHHHQYRDDSWSVTDGGQWSLLSPSTTTAAAAVEPKGYRLDDDSKRIDAAAASLYASRRQQHQQFLQHHVDDILRTRNNNNNNRASNITDDDDDDDDVVTSSGYSEVDYYKGKVMDGTQQNSVIKTNVVAVANSSLKQQYPTKALSVPEQQQQQVVVNTRVVKAESVSNRKHPPVDTRVTKEESVPSRKHPSVLTDLNPKQFHPSCIIYPSPAVLTEVQKVSHNEQVSFNGSDVAYLPLDYSSYTIASSSPVAASSVPSASRDNKHFNAITSPNEYTSMKHLKTPSTTQSTSATHCVTTDSKISHSNNYDDNDDDSHSIEECIERETMTMLLHGGDTPMKTIIRNPMEVTTPDKQYVQNDNEFIAISPMSTSSSPQPHELLFASPAEIGTPSSFPNRDSPMMNWEDDDDDRKDDNGAIDRHELDDNMNSSPVVRTNGNPMETSDERFLRNLPQRNLEDSLAESYMSASTGEKVVNAPKNSSIFKKQYGMSVHDVTNPTVSTTLASSTEDSHNLISNDDGFGETPKHKQSSNPGVPVSHATKEVIVPFNIITTKSPDKSNESISLSSSHHNRSLDGSSSHQSDEPQEIIRASVAERRIAAWAFGNVHKNDKRRSSFARINVMGNNLQPVDESSNQVIHQNRTTDLTHRKQSIPTSISEESNSGSTMMKNTKDSSLLNDEIKDSDNITTGNEKGNSVIRYDVDNHQKNRKLYYQPRKSDVGRVCISLGNDDDDDDDNDDQDPSESDIQSIDGSLFTFQSKLQNLDGKETAKTNMVSPDPIIIAKVDTTPPVTNYQTLANKWNLLEGSLLAEGSEHKRVGQKIKTHHQDIGDDEDDDEHEQKQTSLFLPVSYVDRNRSDSFDQQSVDHSVDHSLFSALTDSSREYESSYCHTITTSTMCKLHIDEDDDSVYLV